jgi:23S rRNA U2552 (ribose-2'-O)-methylase RlmE/FtsJ
MYTTLEVHGPGGPNSVAYVPFHGTYTPVNAYATPESRALQAAKNEIDLFYEEGKWDDYKKITNPYEYIFLSWNRRSSRSVAVRQPLSRSYFKMIEMWRFLNLNSLLEDLVERDGGLKTAHAAEGPGGFIEACTVAAEQAEWEYKSAAAITLRSEAKNVPGWRKAVRFLEANPHVVIHDGADGTGNILLKENQDAFASAASGAHLFTADGGFDFSSDYNAQEDTVFPLLLAEVILGLRTLTKGGVLIIKCFDTMEQPTIDLIWLLTRAFREWGIVKPRTSRAGNAERYILGKGFLGDCEDIITTLTAYQTAGNFKKPILATPVCPTWRPTLLKIAEIQEKIEHVEIQVIQETLYLIKHTEAAAIRMLVRANVLRSIDWCKEHREPIAIGWSEDTEKNVSKETSDLLAILHSNSGGYGSGWLARHASTSTFTFEGFRTGTAIPPPTNNPFMRLKTNTISHS